MTAISQNISGPLQEKLAQTVLILSAFPADWSCIVVLTIVDMYRSRGDRRQKRKKLPVRAAFFAAAEIIFAQQFRHIFLK